MAGFSSGKIEGFFGGWIRQALEVIGEIRVDSNVMFEINESLYFSIHPDRLFWPAHFLKGL